MKVSIKLNERGVPRGTLGNAHSFKIVPYGSVQLSRLALCVDVFGAKQ